MRSVCNLIYQTMPDMKFYGKRAHTDVCVCSILIQTVCFYTYRVTLINFYNEVEWSHTPHQSSRFAHAHDHKDIKTKILHRDPQKPEPQTHGRNSTKS